MSALPFHGVTLAERAEIEALTAEGSWRVDHGRASTIWELNTANVVLRGMKPGEDIVGRDAIRAWGKEREAATRTTRHVVTNVRVFRDAEGTMRSTAVLTMYRHEGEGLGRPSPFMIADFDDRFELGSDGRWLLAERRITPIFIDKPK